mmetsp:Transcript_5161/g.13252  ORF Transcript_5161/g.13252 Transcript_5161/m.13252 type:complete len:84 (+) Transcript_5161:422-673(+)
MARRQARRLRQGRRRHGRRQSRRGRRLPGRRNLQARRHRRLRRHRPAVLLARGGVITLLDITLDPCSPGAPVAFLPRPPRMMS